MDVYIYITCNTVLVLIAQGFHFYNVINTIKSHWPKEGNASNKQPTKD